MIVALTVEIVWGYLPKVHKPLLIKAIICFSPYTNLRAIAKTIDSNAAGQIGCLNGMRFVSSSLCNVLLPKTNPLYIRVISMSWVVLCHGYSYTPRDSGQNPKWSGDVRLYIFPYLKAIVIVDTFIHIQIQIGNTATYGVEVITNGYYNVDTFFFMSGLLVAYLAFIELERKRFNLVMFYVLRYIR